MIRNLFSKIKNLTPRVTVASLHRGVTDNNTPDDAEDQENPVEQNSEEDNREDGRVSPDEQVANKDSEDSNYLPPSEDEVSLDDKNFIMPEEPIDQERFHHRLIATARSLKKKQ